MRWKERGSVAGRHGLRRWVGVVPALLLLLSLVYGSSTSMPTVAAQAITVEIAGFAFAPQTVSIAVGDTIAWHNSDVATHSATSDTAAFDTGLLGNGQTSSPITFNTAGTFPYHCKVHGISMTGTVVVGEAQTAPTLTRTVNAGGQITAAPAGLVTGATTAQYPLGTVVTITAKPDTGQIFVGWTVDGVAAGWASPATITMGSNHTVQAQFVATPAFDDVFSEQPYALPVAELAARGIINGCFTDPTTRAKTFCPTDSTLRHQMAALIVRAMPGWVDETGLPTFSDNTDDQELMRRVATLQRHNVVRGYQDGVCEDRKIGKPCYGPLDNVTYGQALLFIARAMVQHNYWTLQDDDRHLFPDQNGAVGAPADDQQTLDHRAVVTYVHYAGAPPDATITPDAPFLVAGVAHGGWEDASSRGWFARAFWLALNSAFGSDQAGQPGNIP